MLAGYKEKSGLWFCFYPKSLSSVGKPDKAECLSVSMGKMAQR